MAESNSGGSCQHSKTVSICPLLKARSYVRMGTRHGVY